ncbi:MAG TPA: hydantoinase/oxoprolinase family protein, partial [Desulfobacterales bacterium]|nr:hydantoinase/oxoprolinase family protein [Desulfobacterales bacterium]
IIRFNLLFSQSPISGKNSLETSTTFATNAIVEDRGAEAGLILVGYDEIPPEIPRNTRILMIPGGHTVSGEERCPLDLNLLKGKLEPFMEGLDAVAVTGFFSVRNPAHELCVAEYIRDRYDLPVVRGHRLSMRLDAFKRATTAWWNARLIPIISNLIHSCRKVLAQKGINAPLMVVRGDGSLMSDRTALERPVETLLSGPAASVIGGKHLSGMQDALIADMGGTTTDMAVLSGGRVLLDPQGATVGRWKTHVEAARIRTIGIGGDSIIEVTSQRSILVGPKRVIPLCMAAEKHPEILDMLKTVRLSHGAAPCGLVNPCSFYLGNEIRSEGLLHLESERGSIRVRGEYFEFNETGNWFSSHELRRLEKEGTIR